MAGRVYQIPLLSGSSAISQGSVLSEVFTIQATSSMSAWIENIVIDPCTTTVSEIWLAGVRYPTGFNGAKGGTAITPAAVIPGDAAASTQCSIMNTTQTSGATPVRLLSGVWNTLNGWSWTPPDTDHRIRITSAAPLFALQMISGTPASANMIGGYATIREDQ